MNVKNNNNNNNNNKQENETKQKSTKTKSSTSSLVQHIFNLENWESGLVKKRDVNWSGATVRFLCLSNVEAGSETRKTRAYFT